MADFSSSMKNKKKFAIVCFLEEENAIEVIPTTWIINEDKAKWPNFPTFKVIRCIRDRCAASEDWATVAIKIYGYSNSFKRAKSKASIAQDTSNLGTDSSEEEIRKNRKRKVPIKYIGSTMEEDLRIGKKKKLFQIPKTPKITDTLLNMSPVVSEFHMESCDNSLDSRSATAAQATMPNSLNSLLNMRSAASENPTSTLSGVPMAISTSPRNTSSSTPLGAGSTHSPSTTPRETAMQQSFRSISMPSPPTTISRGVAIENRTIDHMFQIIEKLHLEMAALNKKVDFILHKMNNEVNAVFSEPLPPGITLPITNSEDLLDLNNKLLDTEKQITLIRHLYAEGTGKSERSFLTSLIKLLLSKNVAVLYSRLGRKGKMSFKSMTQVYKAVLTAAAMKFKKASKQDLEEEFGKALAGAYNWEGRSLRPSDVFSSTINPIPLLDMALI